MVYLHHYEISPFSMLFSAIESGDVSLILLAVVTLVVSVLMIAMLETEKQKRDSAGNRAGDKEEGASSPETQGETEGQTSRSEPAFSRPSQARPKEDPWD